MNVMGIDLSLTGTGYAVLTAGANPALLTNGVIKSKATDSYTDELKRLLGIVKEIDNLIAAFEVEIAVIEGIAFMARQTTAVMQLAGLNYLVRESLYKSNIPFIIVTPSTLKKFVTGKGNSPKDVMLLETYKKWDVSFSNDNECDAYGLARCGCLLVDGKEHLTKLETEVKTLLAVQYTYGKTKDDKEHSPVRMPQL